MKILLAIILIFPIFNIVAQNPVQPKDSTVGKDELIIISPEKKVHSDTSELMIIRDSSQKHKEANISELFIIGRNAYKRGHICKNDQADGAGTGVCAGHGGPEDPQGIPWTASAARQTKCAKAHGPRHSHKQH